MNPYLLLVIVHTFCISIWLNKWNRANHAGKLSMCLHTSDMSMIFLQLHEATKEKPTLFSPLKACSSNEHNEGKSGKLPSEMELQAQEIAQLQNELAAKLHTISDLKTQLEIQENELSFVHGQLTVKEAADSAQARGLEQLFVANKDTQNKQHFSDTMGHSPDDKLRLDLAFVQAENDRLKAELEAFDPAYFEDLEDLKSEYQQLSTVWSQIPTYSAFFCGSSPDHLKPTTCIQCTAPNIMIYHWGAGVYTVRGASAKPSYPAWHSIQILAGSMRTASWSQRH